MPRSRGTELPQRNSPRVPLHLKTTICTESNSRSTVDRSPKLHHDHRSPRNINPFHEKKRGTRVSDLETKLGKAQEELKKLREQLASVELAKKDAQTALVAAKKHVGQSESVVTGEESVKTREESMIQEVESKNQEVESKTQELAMKESEVKESAEAKVEEGSLNSPPLNATDVFEVIEADKENINEKNEGEELTKVDNEEDIAMKIIEEAVVIQEEAPKESPKQETPNLETIELNLKLLQQEEQIRHLSDECSAMQKKAEEVMERANKMEEGMRVAEAAKQALEGEMRRLRVQTDQWRKAAEEAAALLARGDGDVFEGRKSGARCGGGLDGNGGYGYGWGSPAVVEEDEGRRKSGMRMFGELWKKKRGTTT
ncbi:hypothetical protein LUZ60_000732 [Juncus effusus]|nr:hypothetical protein LUZ60_000732 [Juncus effusus]